MYMDPITKGKQGKEVNKLLTAIISEWMGLWGEENIFLLIPFCSFQILYSENTTFWYSKQENKTPPLITIKNTFL